MAALIICLAAALTSALTLFSGFGLGTLLLPAFALFFPMDAAVAMTAVVHFLNNLFKLALLGRHADRGVVLRFGLPALPASFLGALALVWFSGRAPLGHYTLAGRAYEVTIVKLVVAALMLGFAALEAVPRLRRLAFASRWLPLGGVLSGFFGGLSGHQGALRSAFLVRANLEKTAYLATGIALACLVDLTRLSVYAGHFARVGLGASPGLLAAAAASAFAGAFVASRLVSKVTFEAVRVLVSVLLTLIALGLASGLV
jgi:uncharacterized membrane protein YfcA